MNKKIIILIVLAILLVVAGSLFLTTEKESTTEKEKVFIEKENVSSYLVSSEDEKCKVGYVPTTIVTLNGNLYSCDLASTFVDGPRLIGTGKEIYTLTGYYHEYKREFYFLDDTVPSEITCHGFVVTKGDQGFIDAYKTKIKMLQKMDENIVINFDDMTIGNPPVSISVLDPSSPFSSKIYQSSFDKQIDLKFMVHSFPERDTNPCDSYGIYLIK